MSFQFAPLPYAPFAPLFDLDIAALSQRSIVRVTATEAGAYPCRVSLVDAQIGDTLLLVNHTHLDVASPYASRHAIYVRRDASEAEPAAETIPDILTHRLLSLRGFDANGMMIRGEVQDGQTIQATLSDWFGDPDLAHVDAHSAARGCFLARASRLAN